MSEILMFEKETDHKFRWDAQIEDGIFELYIPKWRVPEPTPERIKVDIRLVGKSTEITIEAVVANPDLKNRSIMALAEYREEMTQTFRYDAVGESNETEIGDPYIPKSLLPSRPERIWLSVEWL